MVRKFTYWHKITWISNPNNVLKVGRIVGLERRVSELNVITGDVHKKSLDLVKTTKLKFLFKLPCNATPDEVKAELEKIGEKFT